MLIGIRKVRSAGHASGSIEITLPPELAPLEGADCRILLRDGARPEIVLQPDVAPAMAVFAQVWAHLRSLLAGVGEIGEFPVQELDVVLLPTSHYGNRVLVACSQAWQVSRAAAQSTASTSRIGATVAEALSGVVMPLGVLAGRRLGLTGAIAAAFGSVLAHLAAPSSYSLATNLSNLEHGMARRVWLEACGPSAPPLRVLAPQPNEDQARQALQRIVGQFRKWQERPDQHELSQVRWGQE